MTKTVLAKKIETIDLKAEQEMTLFDIAKKQNQFASFLTFTNHLDLEEEIYLFILQREWRVERLFFSKER
jgi:hypothetical protein